jgi:hypothetical protein
MVDSGGALPGWQRVPGSAPPDKPNLPVIAPERQPIRPVVRFRLRSQRFQDGNVITEPLP